MWHQPTNRVLYQLPLRAKCMRNAEVVAAACPFCITMFDDGVKGVEAEEKLKIGDIAEIIAGALGTNKQSSAENKL
jgi:Fe-S oxidoreductase